MENALATPSGPASPPGRTSIWQAVGASTVGTIIEWYDFFIYGTASALVFNTLFFPNYDPLAGTLAAFGAYAVGFLVRPLGGILFGYLGDRYGRQPVLIATLLLMALSTALLGLLPSYATSALWALILLLLPRVSRGFGHGADHSGAVVLAAEYSLGGRGSFASRAAAAVDLATLMS